MFGVAFIEQVIDTGGQQQRLIRLPATVDGEHTKASALPQILTDDIALIDCHPRLASHQPPQQTAAPHPALIVEAEAPLQRWLLSQWPVIAEVVAVDIGQTAIDRPQPGKLIAQRQFTAVAFTVDVAGDGGGAHAARPVGLDQDVIVDAVGKERGGSLPLRRFMDPAEIELAVALGAGVEGADGGFTALAAADQLPVIGEALGLPQPEIPGTDRLRQLIADKAAGQPLVALGVGGGVGTRPQHATDHLALILGVPVIQPQAADQGLARRQLPAQLGKQPLAAQPGILHQRQLLIGHHQLVHGRTHRMLVVLIIATTNQGQAVAQRQLQLQPAATGVAGGIADRRVGHHGAGGEGAQAVVVHHMVDVVAIEIETGAAQGLAPVLLARTQPQIVLTELDPIHRPVGVGRLAIAGQGRQLDHAVLIRRPARGKPAIPALIGGMDLMAIAIFIVIGSGLTTAQLAIAEAIAGQQLGPLIVTAKAGAGQGHSAVDSSRVELARLAFKAHGGRRAGAITHRLRPLDHHHAVIVFRLDIGGRRVHAVAAAPQHQLVLGQNGQTRTGHAAKQRVTTGAPFADQVEAGNGLEIVTAIGGRQRLARLFRIGLHHQGSHRVLTGDDDHLHRHTVCILIRLRGFGSRCGGRKKRRHHQAQW